MNRLLSVVVTMGVALCAVAQAQMESLFTPNQYRPVEWQQIKGERADIIFPKELQKEGQRVAALMDYNLPYVERTLGVHTERFPVLLSNQNMTVNGYVALAPRRSEWFKTPPQGELTGANDWYALLAIHETRHISQVSKMNQGFTKLGSILFGQTGRMILSFASAAPPWFWEGDATGTETALSRSGRGRFPWFTMDYRVREALDKRFSYYKNQNGSTKDLVLNHYPLGYVMTTHVKTHYGDTAWDAILNRSARHSYNPLAFNWSVKKETGKHISRIFDDAFNELDSLWAVQRATRPLTPNERVTQNNDRLFINFQYPFFDAQTGELYAFQTGFDEKFGIVRIAADGSTTLLQRLLNFDAISRFSAVNGKMVWVETQYSPRYANETWGRVALFDATTNDVRYLTTQTNFVAAQLSPDGAKVFCVEMTNDRQCNIVLLDATDGKVLQRVASPSNGYINQTCWLPDAQRIAFFHTTSDKGSAVMLFNIADGAFQPLTPYGYEPIAHLAADARYLYYSSPYSGVDDIYALDLQTINNNNGAAHYRVATAEYGAMHPVPSPDGKWLYYTDYRLNGREVVRIALNPASWQPKETIAVSNVDFNKTMVAQENADDYLRKAGDFLNPPADAPAREVHHFTTKAQVPRLHSWGISPGYPILSVSLTGDDLLGNTALRVGATYNVNETALGYGATLAYRKWLPIVGLELRHDDRYGNLNGVENSWKENKATLGVGVPLQFGNTAATTTFLTTAKAGITRLSAADPQTPTPTLGNLFAFTAAAQFDRTIPSYSPRNALGILHQFNTALSYAQAAGANEGSLFSAKISWTLPSPIRFHNIILSANFEQRGRSDYEFSSAFLFPRGYDFQTYQRLQRYSANYAFVVARPDWALKAYLYVKNIRVNAFYDWGIGENPYQTNPAPADHYRSTGAEVLAAIRPLSLPLDLSIGTRLSYLIEEAKPRAELIFGFSF